MTEREIFGIALQVTDPLLRTRYLDEACGSDEALRQRIEKLLRTYEQAGSFLERPAANQGLPSAAAESPANLAEIANTVAATSAPPVGHESPGTQIGPYKLLQEIGQGGMGVVYMAEQLEPVRRKVALKIIKPGMDTRQVIARFEAERQALSLMDHPNIARVFDAGTTSSGRPYFVMELVKGQPITEYCNERHLTPRQRLELLLPVCLAIQHAHQKGIIHRDIKPSNILVAEYDQQPVPKVIDFGVAKATSQALTEKTMFTGYGQIVGTLEYMSPEQAKVNQWDIDTRSDIYSLGVLLYELLTGTTPIDKSRLRSAAWDEMLRMIREEDPPKPSTRLLDSQDSLPSISAQRRTEPAKLTRLVRGELDWIAMKALEKDRARRYESATALAADIERYLTGEPVLAVPPSTAYRLRKFARKHRVALVTVGTFVVLLVGGIVETSLSLVRALAAEKLADERLAAIEQANALTVEALKETTQAKTETEAALIVSENARQQAEAARQRAREALDKLTSDVVERLLGSRVRLAEPEKAFLRDVVRLYEEFAHGQGDSQEVRRDRAYGLFRVSLLRKRLGELQESEAALREALDLRRTLAADFPDVAAHRDDVAQTLGNLANLLQMTGRTEEAQQSLGEARQLLTKLVADFPRESDYRHHLGINLLNLAGMLKESESLAAAEPVFREAISVLGQLVTEFPAAVRPRQQLALCQGGLGILLQDTNRLQEAVAPCRDAVANHHRLVRDYPGQPEYRYALAGSRNVLGRLLWLSGERPEAEGEWRAALAMQQQLATEFPAVPAYRRELAITYGNLGTLLAATGRPQEAESAQRDAIAILQKLHRDFPAVPTYRTELAAFLDALGVILADARQPDEAAERFREAVDLQQKLADDYPSVTNYSPGLASALSNWAKLKIQTKDFAGALALSERAQPHHRRALDANSRDPQVRQSYRNHLWNQCEALFGLGNHAAVMVKAQELASFAGEPVQDHYSAATFASRCVALAIADQSIPEAQREELATKYATEAVRLLGKAVELGFAEPDVLKQDERFAPLRARPEFQDLVQRLAAKRGS